MVGLYQNLKGGTYDGVVSEFERGIHDGVMSEFKKVAYMMEFSHRHRSQQF